MIVTSWDFNGAEKFLSSINNKKKIYYSPVCVNAGINKPAMLPIV
jgi:hypothetical protein